MKVLSIRQPWAMANWAYKQTESTDKDLAQHVAENLRQMHNAAMNAEMEE